MKEPLYRAKTQGSGEWVYGYYCKYGKHIYKIHSINKDGNAVIQCGIDIQTLCEYTGLIDKNGVRIFEDDIVTFDGIHLLTVAFIDFMWGTLYNGVFRHRLENEDSQNIMVVGNLYDNRELLQKGEN